MNNALVQGDLQQKNKKTPFTSLPLSYDTVLAYFKNTAKALPTKKISKTQLECY